MIEQKIFPQIVETISTHKRASYEEKCIFHERLLYQYLWRKIEGWSVNKFLKDKEIASYALYAVTDFTYLFLKDLERKDINSGLKVICDRNGGCICSELKQYQVILPDELTTQYKEGIIKKIIVMSVIHENEIIDELLNRGIYLNDIISFVSVLYS